MAPFSINPRIYSLLVCSQIERDSMTGGWRLNPFSHLVVHSLPVPLNMVLVANIMAPPGEYDLRFSIFHADEAQGVALAAPTRIAIAPGKNVEYLARVSVTLRAAGLYLIEARLIDHDVAYTPIRITPALNDAHDDESGDA
jgi:hypothetical protein